MNRNRVMFSAENKKVFNLALDLARGSFSLAGEGDKNLTKSDLEAYLRDKLNNDVLGGLTLYQAMRRNKNMMFEIVEEIVNVMIGENVFDSPFVNNFVEFKNRDIGDETSFYSEGGLVTAAVFAGNHWDTNRQLVDVGSKVDLKREWVFVHIYDDLERFLAGVSNLEKLMDKVYKAINRYVQDRIYASFKTIKNSVPAEFSGTGNNAEALGKIIDLVQAAGGYSEMTIAGTRAAIRKVLGFVPENAFANSQKEAYAQTGSIALYEGCKVMLIPQTLQSGTFKTALADNEVFILGGDTKPIKVEFIGDTRSYIDTEGKKNNDQSVDIQLQTLLGFGVVLPPYFGHFTLT